MKVSLFRSSLLISMILLSMVFIPSCKKDKVEGNPSSLTPDADNGTLTLANGFGAITVSAQTGRARHIAVNSRGDLFVKLSELKNGNGILVLKDANGDGRSDSETGFGNYKGTGINPRCQYVIIAKPFFICRPLCRVI